MDYDIKTLEAKATPGPWTATSFIAGGQEEPEHREWSVKAGSKWLAGIHFESEANAAFIAAARTAVPALLAERDALAVQVERMRAALVLAEAEVDASLSAEGVFFGDRDDVLDVIRAALNP